MKRHCWATALLVFVLSLTVTSALPIFETSKLFFFFFTWEREIKRPIQATSRKRPVTLGVKVKDTQGSASLHGTLAGMESFQYSIYPIPRRLT